MGTVVKKIYLKQRLSLVNGVQFEDSNCTTFPERGSRSEHTCVPVTHQLPTQARNIEEIDGVSRERRIGASFAELTDTAEREREREAHLKHTETIMSSQTFLEGTS